MFNFWKKILEHVKDYCEEAAIHGLRHIVSQRLTIFERSVSLGIDVKLLQTHHMCCSKTTVLKFYTLQGKTYNLPSCLLLSVIYIIYYIPKKYFPMLNPPNQYVMLTYFLMHGLHQQIWYISSIFLKNCVFLHLIMNQTEFFKRILYLLIETNCILMRKGQHWKLPFFIEQISNIS